MFKAHFSPGGNEMEQEIRSQSQRSEDQKNQYRYDAFISYSHKADADLAKVLENRLEKWAKPFYGRRTASVFRDQTSLTAEPHLWPTIADNLDDSAFLIILASPTAVGSKWVSKEICHWLTAGACDEPDLMQPGQIQQRRVDSILLVLTEGDLVWDDMTKDFDLSKTTALSLLLKGLNWQPRWEDLRWTRGKDAKEIENHDDFLIVIAGILAKIRGQTKEQVLDANDKEQKRTISLFWRLTVGLFVAAFVAVGAAFVANSQRAAATRRSDQLVDLSKELMFDIHDAIALVPGATLAREKIVATSLSHLNKLRQEAGNDPKLIRFIAIAYTKVADVQGNPTFPNLGDTSGAMKSYETALELFNKLTDSEWVNGQAVRDLYLCYERLTDINLGIGDSKAALEWCKRQVDLTKRLHAERPSHPPLIADLANAYNREARIHLIRSDVTKAKAALALSLEFGEALLKLTPGDYAALLHLSQSHRIRADLEMQEENLDQANADCSKSISLLMTAKEKHPMSVEVEGSLAGCHFTIGQIHQRRNENDEAKASLNTALEILERVKATGETDVQLLGRICTVERQLAVIEKLLGHTDDAQRYFKKALSSMKELSQHDPKNRLLQRDLVLVYLQYGEFEEKIQKLQLALDLFQQAWEIASGNYQSDPSDAAFQHDYWFCSFAQGRVWMKKADASHADATHDEKHVVDALKQAQRWFSTARPILQEMSEKGLLEPHDRPALKILDEQLRRLNRALEVLSTDDQSDIPGDRN